MRTNWEGNNRLQHFVRAVDPGAALLAEVVRVIDASVKELQEEWNQGTVTGGSVDFPASGGARLDAGTTSAISQPVDDGTDVTGLSHIPTFDAIVVEWLDGDPDRQIRNLIARLDPRDDGGQPLVVAEWRAQLFRVKQIGTKGEGIWEVEPISHEVVVIPTGEVPSDVTFDFLDGSATGGGPYPRVGAAPIHPDGAATLPLTVVRIIGLEEDGTPAANVTWLADSASGSEITDSATYSVIHYRLLTAGGAGTGEFSGGTVWAIDTPVGNMPRFTLNRASYTAATVTFDGTEEVPDLATVAGAVPAIVARAHVPVGTSVLYEISDDGIAWFTCADGDVIGATNTGIGGNDLSSVATTGPWDIRVTLTPDASGFLTPFVREFGIERIVLTELTGQAEITGGLRQIDPQTLKGNIPRAEVAILKTGERDHRDYGSRLLSENHAWQLEVRVWVGDPTGTFLNRSEWMLHSVYLIDDYRNEDDAHVLECISPMQLLRRRIPPFVPTTGNDGDRTAVEYAAQTPAVVYADILDNQVGLATRYRGPGVEETGFTIGKTVKRADAKDELDRVAFLVGYSVIESQGRIKAVPVMRDGAGAGVPQAFFPIGSYTPGRIGPGLTSRTDEYFVRYNWNGSRGDFDDERRYVNGAAIVFGQGLETTDELDAETGEWISTEALADLVGRRFPLHFGNGLILWALEGIDRHPELEPGDVVAIETAEFVARSPLNNEPVLGPIYALAVLTTVADHWGHGLVAWVPGFDKIVLLNGTVTIDGFALFDLALDFGVVFNNISTAGGNLVLEWFAGSDVEQIRLDLAYFDGEIQSWNYTFATSGARQGEHTIEDDVAADLFAQTNYTLWVISGTGQRLAGDSGLQRTRNYPTTSDISVAVSNVRAVQGATDLIGSGLRIGQAGYLALGTASSQPEVELSMGVFDAGAQGSNFSLDYADGPAQVASITASVELTDLSNLDGSTPMSVRISCGANTLTLNGTNFEGPDLSFTGVVSLSFMDFGTGAIAVAGIEY